MPIILNGTTLTGVSYNGTALSKVYYNGTEVFSAQTIERNYLVYSRGVSTGYDYRSSLAESNLTASAIGRAVSPNSSSGNRAAVLKFAVPSDWDAVTAMSLSLYRTSGSAQGYLTIGSYATVIDTSTTVSYSGIYNMSSAREVSASISANAGQKWFDILSLKSYFKASSSGGYFCLCVHDTGAYDIANLSPSAAHDGTCAFIKFTIN